MMDRWQHGAVAVFVVAFASPVWAQSWTTPRTWVSGEVVTAAIMNTHVRDNLDVLRVGGLSVTSQAAGDILCASSTTQFGRIASFATGQVLSSQGVGQCPTFLASPSLTDLTLTGVLDVPDGSAASPSLSFSNDLNTGVYRVTTDSIGISTGGVLRADITTTRISLASGISLQTVGGTFAGLPGSPLNGDMIYCSDCTKATPCASGGTGAMAFRINGAWECNP